MTNLKPRLVTTEHGRYEPASYNGKNLSGIKTPLGDRIVVLPDESATTIGKAGKILIAADTQATHSLGAVTGTIISIGDEAWKSLTNRPRPGDRVIFNRYSGQVLLGLDGRNYRIMSEATIGGILDDSEGTETP
jgi:co-chaperonin GroES (HSP10)